MKQITVKRRPRPTGSTTPADAPTVNDAIARTWFSGES